MEIPSHFRFVFLVLASLLLPGVLSLSSGCERLCKRVRENQREKGSFTLDCERKYYESGCGHKCEQHCTSSDCDSNGNVPCPDPTDMWLWIGIGVGVLLLIIIIASVGACIYCCVRGSRRQAAPGMAGPGGVAMAPAPQMGVYSQPQPQMQQPVGGYAQGQPQQQQAVAGGYQQGQPQQPQQQPQSNNPFLRAQQAPATPPPTA